MFTSDEDGPFYNKEKGSNKRLLKPGACVIANMPLNMTNQMRQRLHYIKLKSGPKTLTTDKMYLAFDEHKLLPDADRQSSGFGF